MRLGLVLALMATLALVTAGLVAAKDPKPVKYKANGHHYEAVAVAGGITWGDTYVAAAQTKGKCSGHLAKITSQAETDFLIANLPAEAFGGNPIAAPVGYWFGGFQHPEPPGDEGDGPGRRELVLGNG